MAETPEQEPQNPDAAAAPPPVVEDDVIVPPAAPDVPAWTAPAAAAWTPTQVPGTGALPDTVVPSSAPSTPYAPSNPYAAPAPAYTPPANPYAAPEATNPYAAPAPANPYTPPAANPYAPPTANPYAPANPYAQPAPAQASPYPPAAAYGQVDPNRPNPYAAQGVSVGTGYGQAPPGYPGSTQSYAGYPVAATPPKGLSITSMVLGVGGLLFGFLFGGLPSIGALVTGLIARRREPAARGFWLTGIITGAAGIAFGLLAVILYVLFAISVTNENSYY